MIAFPPETLNPEARKEARPEERTGRALFTALERLGMPQLLGIALLTMAGLAMMEGTCSLLVNQRFDFGQREVDFLSGSIGILIVLYRGGLVRVVAKRIPERCTLLGGLVLLVAFLPLLPWVPWSSPGGATRLSNPQALPQRPQSAIA